MQEEREAAAEISDDHIVAFELGNRLSELFPTIRTGYLVSVVALCPLANSAHAGSALKLRLGHLQIAKVNGVPTEGLDFHIVMGVLDSAQSPNNLEFRRHDYLKVLHSPPKTGPRCSGEDL